MMLRSLLVTLVVLALPALAAADAIMPPPDDLRCRPGERLVNDHGGARCELPFCETQADCPTQTRCPQRHCYAMVPSRVAGCPGVPEGSKEPPDPCDPVREQRGPCADAAPQCPDGESCGLAQCEWEGEPPPVAREDPRAASNTGDTDEGDTDEDDTPSTPPESRSGGGCSGSRGTSGAVAWSLLAFGVVGIAFGRRRG
ncbi:MAG: hypothetical protein AB8I08_27805 [Sandaracinaceae bacterium]